jgi:hypothetical protein
MKQLFTKPCFSLINILCVMILGRFIDFTSFATYIGALLGLLLVIAYKKIF